LQNQPDSNGTAGVEIHYSKNSIPIHNFSEQCLKSNFYLAINNWLKSKMVRLRGETSNTLADDLFETLEDWNAYLQAEKIDFSELSQAPVGKDESKPKKTTVKRQQLRRPQP